ncbi:MAG: pyridoxal phosphate-dependent aminotransferase, partial [Acidobacteriaceae bacterium]|nr:pyridoxal phosphate-dependent aminotransferase [Acidobacteriaceae bacterium]
GWTHYGPTQGFPELREAIAAYVSRTRNVTVGAEHVCVVPGGKPIMFFVMLALLEPGDEVIYPDPGFPIYRSMVRFLDARPVPIPLVEGRGFSLDLDMLRDRLTHKTKLLILNSPQNPTGGIIPESDIRAIADMLRERDVLVLSDEIYSRIFYTPDPPFSIASLPGMPEKTVVLDGFSKTYAMTGWRIGYGVMPDWLVEAVNKLMVNSNSCTASFTQRAAIAALTGDQTEVEDMIRQFRTRRDAFCAALNEIPGFHCNPPGGAFYAYANVKNTGMSSSTLANLLLEEAGVACLNGEAFGEMGAGYIRFSYANSIENLLEAARRMQAISGRWASELTSKSRPA